MKNKVIITCNRNSLHLAVYELEKYDLTFSFVEKFNDEVALITTELSNSEFLDLIRKKPIIFIKHLFFIDCISVPKNLITDLNNTLKKMFDVEESFNVQIRGDKSDATPDLLNTIINNLLESGYTQSQENPQIIVSIFVYKGMIYWGVGAGNQNLSCWNGGSPHYSYSNKYDFISRAEFKLIEAIDCFGINLDEIKTGADLGASPGGWTKVLISNGIRCDCIDPSYLNESISKSELINYYHMKVEDFLKLENDTHYDIVVNDMKMDVKKSVNIINDFYGKIADNGIVIMTFKLPHDFDYKYILEGFRLFNGYSVIGARQLSFNRSEITVVLRKDLPQFIRKNNNKKKKTYSKKLQRKINRKKEGKNFEKTNF